MAKSRKGLAVLSLTAAIVSWASAPVFIRYLDAAYDPHSQAFIRYTSATTILVVLSLLWYRAEFLRLLVKSRTLLGIACLNAFQQTTWTIGTCASTATLAQLITKSNVVLIIVLSFFLFREERRVIRSPLFLIGTALSLVGVAGVLARDPSSLLPVFDKAAALLVLTAVCWGVYLVWSKHAVMGMSPIPMFAVVSVYTSVFLGIGAFALGEPKTLIEGGIPIAAIAYVSGLLPIATAHPSFNYAQKHLGAALSNSCNLLTPFLTFVMGMIVLGDEYLTPIQWAAAVILISGTGCVTFAGQRAHRNG